MSEFIEVVCLVLPTGEALWFKASQGSDYLKKVLDKWKAEHPKFAKTPCSAGAVHITMPYDKYLAIGAHSGPGSFEWPQ